MSKGSNQKLKMLYLLKILSEKTDEAHCLSAQELIAELQKYEVSAERKSIYNDIECLTDFGYDIVNKKAKTGGGYYLASREFELPELKAPGGCRTVIPLYYTEEVAGAHSLRLRRLPDLMRRRSCSVRSSWQVVLKRRMKAFIITWITFIMPFRTMLRFLLFTWNGMRRRNLFRGITGRSTG